MSKIAEPYPSLVTHQLEQFRFQACAPGIVIALIDLARFKVVVERRNLIDQRLAAFIQIESRASQLSPRAQPQPNADRADDDQSNSSDHGPVDSRTRRSDLDRQRLAWRKIYALIELVCLALNRLRSGGVRDAGGADERGAGGDDRGASGGDEANLGSRY